jgi:hypothetical protein
MSLISAFSPMTKERLEILRMAKEILFNEYIDKKAQLHNQWLADSETAWRTRRMRLPYPIFPAFPDNEMIIARAIQLEKYLNTSHKSEEPPVKTVEPARVEEVPVKEVPVKEVEIVEPVKEEKRNSIVPVLLEKNDYFNKKEEAKELLVDKPSILPNDDFKK